MITDGRAWNSSSVVIIVETDDSAEASRTASWRARVEGRGGITCLHVRRTDQFGWRAGRCLLGLPDKVTGTAQIEHPARRNSSVVHLPL